MCIVNKKVPYKLIKELLMINSLVGVTQIYKKMSCLQM